MVGTVQYSLYGHWMEEVRRILSMASCKVFGNWMVLFCLDGRSPLLDPVSESSLGLANVEEIGAFSA